MKLSYSSLKEFAKSPNHFIQYIDRELEASDAMIFGSAVHCAILEPNEFQKRYFVLDETEIMEELKDAKSPRATKAYKQWKSDEISSAGYREILDTDTMARLNACTNSFADNMPASNLLSNAIGFEKKIIFNHLGNEIRGYIDIYGRTFTADLKVIRSADPKWMSREVFNAYWHMQGAIYTKAMSLENEGQLYHHYIVAIENQAPFNTQVYKLNMEFLTRGWLDFDKLVQAVNSWDGLPASYDNNSITLELPKWA